MTLVEQLLLLYDSSGAIVAFLLADTLKITFSVE